MPIGKCGLCHAEEELRDSHLLPKAFYKLISSKAKADGAPNTNPVVFTQKIAIQTSQQVSDYFLCAGCEDLLNKRGEKWVTANCWRSASDAPIHTALANATPSYVAKERPLQYYAGKSVDGVNVPQLTHFAAGVFWRAGARQWGPIAGHRPLKLSLGPYEEQLRRFVFGEAEFPEHAVLLVTVNSSTDPRDNITCAFPYFRNSAGGFRQYLFSIPGITFQLMLGKAIPPPLRQGCLVRSRDNIIFCGPFESLIHDYGKILTKSKPKGSLAQKLTKGK